MTTQIVDQETLRLTDHCLCIDSREEALNPGYICPHLYLGHSLRAICEAQSGWVLSKIEVNS